MALGEISKTIQNGLMAVEKDVAAQEIVRLPEDMHNHLGDNFNLGSYF